MNKTIILSLILSIVILNPLFAVELKQEDKNQDGRPDFWMYFKEDGRPEKIESDRDYDGKIDLWIFYKEGGKRVLLVDLNFDGRPDMTSRYEFGQRIGWEIDKDYDGNIDQRNTYEAGRLVKMERDTNGDGVLEIIFDRSQSQLKQKIIEKKIESPSSR